MRPAAIYRTPAQQALLDEAMARIEAACPKRDGLEKLCAALVKQPNFKFIEMGEGA